ncbi:MAG: hypothetical protein V3573_11140 [Desulfovibrionaceae bacterium]
MFQTLCVCLVLSLSFALPAFADCKSDFDEGVRLVQEAREAKDQQNWSRAARVFEQAADAFDLAAESCDGQNAATSRENAMQARKMAHNAQAKESKEKAYADVARAEQVFERAVALTDKNNYHDAKPLFEEAAELWARAVDGLDESDKQKARNNVETAAHNAAACQEQIAEGGGAPEEQQPSGAVDQENLLILALAEGTYEEGSKAYDAGRCEEAKPNLDKATELYEDVLPKLGQALKDQTQAPAHLADARAKSEDCAMRLAEQKKTQNRAQAETGGQGRKIPDELFTQLFALALAEVAYEDGLELYKTEQWAEALNGFEQSANIFRRLLEEMTNDELLTRTRNNLFDADVKAANCRKQLGLQADGQEGRTNTNDKALLLTALAMAELTYEEGLQHFEANRCPNAVEAFDAAREVYAGILPQLEGELLEQTREHDVEARIKTEACRSSLP